MTDNAFTRRFLKNPDPMEVEGSITMHDDEFHEKYPVDKSVDDVDKEHEEFMAKVNLPFRHLSRQARKKAVEEKED